MHKRGRRCCRLNEGKGRDGKVCVLALLGKKEEIGVAAMLAG
nr:hypothetical protein [Cucumis melo subsp. melo]